MRSDFALRRPLARLALALPLLILPLLAPPLLADEAAKTREQLEQEIAERQAQLDRLAERAQPAEEAPAEEAPPPVEEPERRRHRDEDVTFGSSRHIKAGEDAPPIVLIGGYLELEKHAAIEGDVTVVGGGAKIGGKVYGTLVVVGGSVELADGAEVEGDVVSIGGPIRERGDTRVEGQKVQIAFGEIAGLGPIFGEGGFGGTRWGSRLDFSVLDLLGRFFRVGLLLVIVFLVKLIAPDRSAAIAAQVRAQPWRAGLIGLLAQVLFLPLFLLVLLILLISVIGIPLVLVVPPLMLLSLLVFFVLGYTGVALAAGRVVERRFDKRLSAFALLLVGILLIEGWSLAGELLMSLPGPIKLTALLALAFGFLVQYLAWTVGLGAVLGDLSERRRLARAEALAERRLVDHLDPE